MLGFTPAESLFVDDLAANVAGAREAGLHGHVFTGSAALSDKLRRHHLRVTEPVPAPG
ncbi:hypothetical protein [Luteibacter flocculans]|uniref:hypothetical protein n=1 Tax=Luteibacter flocculans TaxID=2780091 RepID=UPI003CE4B2E4